MVVCPEAGGYPGRVGRVHNIPEVSEYDAEAQGDEEEQRRTGRA